MNRPALFAVLLLAAAFLLWQFWAFLAVLKWLALLGLAGAGLCLLRRLIRHRS